MKKVVVVCMALLLALVGTGVAYAMWSDNIQIAGTVETGSVDIVLTRTDGDNIYKDLDTGDLVYDHWIKYLDTGVVEHSATPPVNNFLVAWTTAEQTADDVETISYHNLFPWNDGPYGDGGFATSARMHYVGSVPVHLKVTPTITDIPESWVSYVWFVYESEGGPLVASGTDLKVLDGMQLHYCMIVSIGIIVTVPQLDSAMNQSGSISLTIQGIQWNEYP